MSHDLFLLFATLGAAAVAGIATYIATRRVSRGTVQTSEASDLWEEANNLRKWLTTEVSQLRAKDEQQELRLRQQDEQIQDLRRHVDDCEKREERLKHQLAMMGGSNGAS